MTCQHQYLQKCYLGVLWVYTHNRVLYTAKLSRGKTFVLQDKTSIYWKSFTVNLLFHKSHHSHKLKNIWLQNLQMAKNYENRKTFPLKSFAVYSMFGDSCNQVCTTVLFANI